MFAYRYGQPFCTDLVILITAVVSFIGFQSSAFQEKYLFWPEAILAWKERYRVFTSGFLHLDMFHLAGNMFTLYLFGQRIEMDYGWGAFLGIYFAAIIGGSLVSLYVHRWHDYTALGASGGVSGILLAYTLLFPRASVSMIYLPIFIPAWLYAICFLFASFIGMHRQMNNVGHDAHLGGALVGLYTAAALHPAQIRSCPYWFAGISIGTILLYAYMSRDVMYIPLEGIDFTKPVRPSANNEGGRKSWLPFNFGRKRSSATNERFVVSSREVDAILQKISAHGIHSLTKEEQELLNKTSNQYRQREKRDKPQSGFPF